jgi:hypothetical protein
MPDPFIDETKATARLPGLDIEILRRRSPKGDADLLSVKLQATPSFAAFGEYLESANPWTLWLRLAELAWRPWLGAFGPTPLPGPAPREDA